MRNTYSCPQYWNGDILRMINKFEAPYKNFREFDELSVFISRQIANGKIIGWFQGEEWSLALVRLEQKHTRGSKKSCNAKNAELEN